jgi:hypothetical protein
MSQSSKWTGPGLVTLRGRIGRSPRSTCRTVELGQTCVGPGPKVSQCLPSILRYHRTVIDKRDLELPINPAS